MLRRDEGSGRLSRNRDQTFRVMSGSTGAIVAERAAEATSVWARLVGLLGRAQLAPGEALWLQANGVHTLGMRFAIDIVILDGTRRVLRVAERIGPNRIVWPVCGGRITLELPAGALSESGLSVGDTLVRVPNS
jgi:uncharacterized membrane protein (UPF0127 family)